MQVPSVRTGLIALSIFAVMLAALGIIASSDTSQAATYNPSADYYLENCQASDFPSSKPITDSDLAGDGNCDVRTAGTNTVTDITTTLDVLGGDSNFGSAVVTMGNSAFDTAADADIPDGEKIGALESVSTLGLLNGPCSTTITVDFILFESSTSGSLTTNPEGTPDRWSTPGESGSGGGGPNGIVTDADNNDLGDSTSAFVGTNPDIYAPLFDPDLDYVGGPNGAIPPITPLARYTGMTRVPAVTGDWQLLSFFQFEARDLQPFAEDPDNKAHIWGFTGATDYGSSSSALNDLVATETSPSSISDFCAPLGVTTMLLGTTPGGQTRFTTPSSAGTYEFFQHSLGFRDADNDGLENGFDTCPFNADTGLDDDSDGIDNACDAGPTVGQSDVDGDGFSNRQDGCPQISDGPGDPDEQVNSELQTTYTAAAPDGGPKSDQITDACDPNDTTANTEGSFVRATSVMTVCIGSTDGDGDGICDGDEATYSPDDDFDGWDTACETTIGTDPNDKSANTVTANDEADDKWPPDFDDNKTINIIDVLALKPVFGTPSVRHDMDCSGGAVNIIDVLALKPVFNKKSADDITGAPPN